mmetsp:Transcript_19431/g.27364  ORF Transcript_19431/g.27364 Transcript_19431/m.27364 type:complete len:313 (+) Transcript_19431:168-1106(+)|eukprot:CAMPEP_0185253924 /NCGR_PEP_ID=MMETSP1359-20130426/2506_1 /TAXON_ID=552665 /ORGANISM="Bigelowiella longifila, Strain CCMP242" /LENGTH=312 /DNA_ID=CAMNT_0027836409 /DNA_START=84 /DNA_END=1022 /DNA_ORIENTATION=-
MVLTFLACVSFLVPEAAGSSIATRIRPSPSSTLGSREHLRALKAGSQRDGEVKRLILPAAVSLTTYNNDWAVPYSGRRDLRSIISLADITGGGGGTPSNGEGEKSSGGRIGGKVIRTNKLFDRGIQWERVPEQKRRVVKYLWRGGWFAWWSQLILTAISTVTLTFAATVGNGLQSPVSSGLISSLTALGAVAASWLWMYRFTRIATRIASGGDSGIVQAASQTGIKLNLVGMGLAIVSAEQIVGSLVAAALMPGQSLTPGGYVDNRSTLTLKAFVLQSNTNVLMAAFIGLLTSWLINQVSAKLSENPLATAK